MIAGILIVASLLSIAFCLGFVALSGCLREVGR